MKSIQFIGAVFCSLLFVFSANAQKVIGDGIVKEVEIKVKPFNHIVVNGKLNVSISQNTKQQECVSIEADLNLHEFIKVENKSNQLVISLKKGVQIESSTMLLLRVSLKHIMNLDVKNGANVSTAGSLKLSRVYLNVSENSSANITATGQKLISMINSSAENIVAGKFEVLEMKKHGDGTLNLSNLSLNKAVVTNSGEGDVTVVSKKEFRLINHGKGNIFYSGDAVVKTDVKNGKGKNIKK